MPHSPVVTLCPGKVAVIDVDSYRAIAIVPAWTDSVPSKYCGEHSFNVLIPSRTRSKCECSVSILFVKIV